MGSIGSLSNGFEARLRSFSRPALPFRCQCHKTFFPLSLMSRASKLEHFHLVITFQSSLTFAGNTRGLQKKEASERCFNWVGSSLGLKFEDLTGKGFQGQML